IIALVETWDEGDAPTMAVPNFYIFHEKALRTAERGRASGGIAVAVNPFLQPSLITSSRSFIVIRTIFAYVLVFYFQPTTYIEIIVSDLFHAIAVCNDKTLPLLLLGDFNARVDVPNMRGDVFKEVTSDNGLLIL